jgi:putative transposase
MMTVETQCVASPSAMPETQCLRRNALRLYIFIDMTDLYKNKYRISSARLQTWDYADNGLYFITICTAERECFFGDIPTVETQCLASPDNVASPDNIASPDNNIMQLNDLGKHVEAEWLNTRQLRPDMNIELQEYVVMPNHFHGIIHIGENAYNNRYLASGDAKHCVSTSDTFDATFKGRNRFQPQSKNLASIIRGFKAAVTTYARKNEIPFNWQARFHDHIITSNDEYIKIANYIIDNPAKWQMDKFIKITTCRDAMLCVSR